jgi:cyclic beta-1,2-glucan synthetase
LGEGDKAAALFWMLNPINHARTQGDVHRYKVEPYVVAADIYSAQGQSGRGGWTWYTGSSGWMLRAGLESILGLRREGASLIIDPCIPKSWPGFTITYLFEAARYEIRVENQGAGGNTVIDATVGGAPVTERPVRFALDPTSRTHAVRVIIGADNPRP